VKCLLWELLFQLLASAPLRERTIMIELAPRDTF